MGAFDSEKTMFEIYRETQYTGLYKVVYYTELQDHNKDSEINHALAGEHYFDGFLKNFGKEDAKQLIDGILARLNSGECLKPEQIAAELSAHLA